MLSDSEFRILLDRLDRPWAGFRKVRKGVKKRLRRHMQTLGCSTVEQYIQHLQRQPGALAVCQEGLRVTISRFYRDRALWQSLQTQILPDLVRRFPDPIRIWSAGCACGEEPYSLAMVWNEMESSARLDLLATDADSTCLDRARAGRYPPSSLKEVPSGLQEQYFRSQKGGRQWIIRHDRLPPIHWHRHDFLDSLPEPGLFQLILLRNNLLTYYRGSTLRTALAQILARLSPGGGLVIGSHEHLPPGKTPLIRTHSCPWLYRLEN